LIKHDINVYTANITLMSYPIPWARHIWKKTL